MTGWRIVIAGTTGTKAALGTDACGRRRTKEERRRRKLRESNCNDSLTLSCFIKISLEAFRWVKVLWCCNCQGQASC
ncbi:unnamed protein product [Rhodiola kirilowii]